jgi:flavin-dependent dehydrogenase
LVVRQVELRSIGGWQKLLASVLDDNRHLKQRLQKAIALWDRPLAISSIPYGHLAGQHFGLWCVGDQAAVIPSFTGDGMSIALHSASLATEMYLTGNSAEQYNHRLHAQLSRGMGLATCLSRSMVTKAGRILALFGFAAFPNAMQWIAASTRIPKHSIVAPLFFPRTENSH